MISVRDFFFFFSSRRRHTRFKCDWSSDVCSSDLTIRVEDMRICLLTYRGNPYSGGQGIYIYYLSREFQRMGHEVEVISSAPFPEVSEGIILHQLRSSSIYHPGSSFKKNLPRVRN